MHLSNWRSSRSTCYCSVLLSCDVYSGAEMVCHRGYTTHCLVAKRGDGLRHSCQESLLISSVISANGRRTVLVYLYILLHFPDAGVF